jgi:hypothetical protein
MPWFETEGQSLYDSLREARFHLIMFADGNSQAPPVPEGWKDRIDPQVLPLDEVVREHFGRDDPFYVVLRPDNYIGLISDDLSAEGLADYLENFS